jgi:hypothetical protein
VRPFADGYSNVRLMTWAEFQHLFVCSSSGGAPNTCAPSSQGTDALHEYAEQCNERVRRSPEGRWWIQERDRRALDGLHQQRADVVPADGLNVVEGHDGASRRSADSRRHDGR